MKNNKLKKLLDETSKNATHIISGLDTIEDLKAKGLPRKTSIQHRVLNRFEPRVSKSFF